MIFNFVMFVFTKKAGQQIFFPLLFCCCCWIRDLVWIKNRIRDKHPGSATLNKSRKILWRDLVFLVFWFGVSICGVCGCPRSLPLLHRLILVLCSRLLRVHLQRQSNPSFVDKKGTSTVPYQPLIRCLRYRYTPYYTVYYHHWLLENLSVRYLFNMLTYKWEGSPVLWTPMDS